MSQNSDYPAVSSMVCRIEILENFYNKMEHLITHAQDGIEKCFERIEALEKFDSYIEKMSGLTDRIDRLEAAYKADAEVAKDIIYTSAKCNEEVRQIKSECDTHCGAILSLEQWRDSFKEVINDMI